LIGLQLPHCPRRDSWIRHGAFAALWRDVQRIVIVLRLLWMFPGGYLAYSLSATTSCTRDSSAPSQGKSSLSLDGHARRRCLRPACVGPSGNLPDGSPFPQRDLIILPDLSVMPRNARLARVDFAPANSRSVSSVRLELKTKKTRPAGSSPANRANPPQKAPLRRGSRKNLAAVYDDLSRRYTRRLASLSKENSDDDGMSNQELAVRVPQILGQNSPPSPGTQNRAFAYARRPHQRRGPP